MDNKFKPISRPTYGTSQNAGAPYSRPVSYNKPQPQQPIQQPEYQQPVQEPAYQQEEYAPTPSYSSGKESKSNKKLIFGIVGAVVVLAVAILFFTLKGGKNVNEVENVFGNESTVGTQSTLLSDNIDANSFNGSAVEVPWPSDITPTKMEINLDPNTGDPVLMLVGEKTGVGTVIRSYNKAGTLTGFWVIVSSDPVLTNGTVDNTATGITGTAPTLEQTIADEVYTYIGTNVTGKTYEDLIKDYNAQLTATATKYGKTVEEVLNYYLTATGLTPAPSTTTTTNTNNTNKTTKKN